MASLCAERKPIAVGGACSPVESSSICAFGATCSSTDYTCGGLDANCVANDGTPTGPSADCSAGREYQINKIEEIKAAFSFRTVYFSSVSCLKGSCSTLSSVALGAQCLDTLQCPGSSDCSGGVCGGMGSICDKTSSCAPNRKSVTSLE